MLEDKKRKRRNEREDEIKEKTKYDQTLFEINSSGCGQMDFSIIDPFCQLVIFNKKRKKSKSFNLC